MFKLFSNRSAPGDRQQKSEPTGKAKSVSVARKCVRPGCTIHTRETSGVCITCSATEPSRIQIYPAA